MGIPVMTVTLVQPDPRLMLRAHNRALRAAYRVAAEYHRDRHIRRHFEAFAPAKYGYLRRTARYQKYKANVYGSTLDLVKTGATRAALTAPGAGVIRATPKGSTLSLKLPIKGGSGRIQSAAARQRLGRKALSRKGRIAVTNVLARVAEVEAIAPDEINTLRKVVETAYAKHVEAEIAASSNNLRKRFRLN